MGYFIPPSGNKGLILGDIFGRNAGLTCTDAALFLFLLPRPIDLGSARLPEVELVGDAMAPSCGLGNIEFIALNGALAGPFGSLRAVIVGVASSSLACTVLIGASIGFVGPAAGSGKTILSIICSISASAIEACSFRLEVRRCPAKSFPFCFLIFINDAGVAGWLPEAEGASFATSACLPDRCGDLPEISDLGVAGGGIKISDKGSGDIDSAPELSCMAGMEVRDRECSTRFDFRASSKTVETPFGGIVELIDCLFLL